jgi:hypothetical protein
VLLSGASTYGALKGYKYYKAGQVQYKVGSCFLHNNKVAALAIQKIDDKKGYMGTVCFLGLCQGFAGPVREFNEELKLNWNLVDCDTGVAIDG